MCGTEMPSLNEKKTKRIGGNGSGQSQTDKRPATSDAGPSLCLSFVSPSCRVVSLSPLPVMLLPVHA